MQNQYTQWLVEAIASPSHLACLPLPVRLAAIYTTRQG